MKSLGIISIRSNLIQNRMLIFTQTHSTMKRIVKCDKMQEQFKTAISALFACDLKNPTSPMDSPIDPHTKSML